MRKGVREIIAPIGLPADTPLPVYYNGLGILGVTWEASLQHINTHQTILKINDNHLHITMDLEIKQFRDRLDGVTGTNVRAIRTGRRT